MINEKATLPALEAEASLELRAHLIGEAFVAVGGQIHVPYLILRQLSVSVEALVAAVTLAVLLDALTEGLERLDVFVEERAIVSLHAATLQPKHVNLRLVFRLLLLFVSGSRDVQELFNPHIFQLCFLEPGSRATLVIVKFPLLRPVAVSLSALPFAARLVIRH